MPAEHHCNTGGAQDARTHRNAQKALGITLRQVPHVHDSQPTTSLCRREAGGRVNGRERRGQGHDKGQCCFFPAGRRSKDEEERSVRNTSVKTSLVLSDDLRRNVHRLVQPWKSRLEWNYERVQMSPSETTRCQCFSHRGRSDKTKQTPECAPKRCFPCWYFIIPICVGQPSCCLLRYLMSLCCTVHTLSCTAVFSVHPEISVRVDQSMLDRMTQDSRQTLFHSIPFVHSGGGAPIIETQQRVTWCGILSLCTQVGILFTGPETQQRPGESQNLIESAKIVTK